MPDLAQRTLDTATQLEPENVSAWVNLGTVLLALDRPREALAAFERARTIDPSHPAANAGVSEARRRAVH